MTYLSSAAQPYHTMAPSDPAGSAGVGPGRIQQAFVFSLKEDLTEYYRLIAVLGAQLNLESEGVGVGAGGTEGLTLQRLFVWVKDPMKRLNVMATLVAAAAQLKVEMLVYPQACSPRHDRWNVTFERYGLRGLESEGEPSR